MGRDKMKSTMTKLEHMVSVYRSRAQFHDQPKLDAIIQAVREEEQQKYRALIEAAKSVLETVESGP